MRRNSFISGITVWTAALLTLSATTSCVHEFPEDTRQQTVKCYVHLRYDTSDMPLFASLEYDENGVTRRTRARGPEDPLDFRYILKVYDDQDYRSRASGTRGEIHEVSLTVPATGESPDRTFEVDLPAGDYSILGWSDFVDAGKTDDKYYATDDMRAVTVIQDSRGNHPGGYEGRQCFRGDALVAVTLPDPVAYDEVTEPKTIDVYIDMERPIAKFRFIATDSQEFLTRGTRGLDDYYAVISYPTYMPSTFNARLDKPTDSRTGQYFSTDISAIDEHKSRLGFDYMFVNHNDASAQVAVDIYEKKTNKKISSSGSITIPLRRGHVTEISGKFFTTTNNSGMGINPDFDGEFNIEIK